MTKAFAYLRVSGKSQIDGDGFKRQLETIREYATELQVLRRMFSLAQEWSKVEKVLPKVRMLPGERHRERVLTLAEETGYLKAAREWDMTENARALLPDAATVLLDCALRPEEWFRLRWSNVRKGTIEIEYGKTDNARRKMPPSQRVAAILEMRAIGTSGEWVFPAETRSGHIEPASLKRQHLRACKEARSSNSRSIRYGTRV